MTVLEYQAVRRRVGGGWGGVGVSYSKREEAALLSEADAESMTVALAIG